MTEIDADPIAAVPEIDFFADGVKADPWPHYRRLRELDPIHQSPLDPHTWLLTRYDDCADVLKDVRWSADPSHRTTPPPTGEFDMRTGQAGSGLNVLLFLDPPDHTRLRKLVSKAFTPRTVEALRPRIQSLVDGILDTAAERGELDVVGDLGFLLPVTVICELMGVPVEDHAQFGPWSAGATRLLDGILPPEEAATAVAGVVQIITYFGELFEQRRAEPADDLVSALLAAEEAGDRLSPEELNTMTVLVFVAGHETTTNLIGNGTKALLDHPDQLERLRRDPSLIPLAVEELLRFDGPVHLTGRVASEPLEVGGRRFETGDQVLALLAAANRDPARYERPDELDIGRTDNHHLTFSGGIHYCLGAALARIEGQIAIGSLVQRFGQLDLLTEAPEYREHNVLRGLRELRVAVS